MASHPLHIFTGSCYPQLAQEIGDYLNLPVGKAKTTHLPDSEIHVKLDEVVREHDVFFIQSISRPVNEGLMELLLFIDAFRRASVNKINVVIPYFPYARQERMATGREAISARVVADLIERQGASRVIFIDIHNPAIQGFFNIPVDPLSAVPTMCNHLRKFDLSDSVIVSPDVGRASLAGKYAELLDLPLVVMHKRRENFSDTKVTHLVGDIRGKRPILIDDMIAGGSVLKQIDTLYEHGASKKLWASITHPILLPSAINLLNSDDRIEKLLVTNTLQLPEEALNNKKIEQITIAPLLASIIEKIYKGQSISNQLLKS